MTPDDARAEQQRLLNEANRLITWLMKRLEKYPNRLGEKNTRSLDARVVAVACARVAGSYIALIKDPDQKAHYKAHFLTLFAKIIDTPPVQLPETETKQ